jgi:oxalate decarboxylase/phosphoglucose isomerase-like protein (cupin superfamily)
MEFSVPAQFSGAPMHFHERMTESFYMLEGKLELLFDGSSRILHPGEFVLVPPPLVHGYRNPFQEQARFLITAPGHDRFFFELIAWIKREPAWPPADKNLLITFGKRHDTIYV